MNFFDEAQQEVADHAAKNMPEVEAPVALIDLDGSVANMAKALVTALNSMRSPGEDELTEATIDNPPTWLDTRMDYIKQRPGFWQNLEEIPEGMQVVQMMRNAGYALNILSKGPRKAANAWTEKLLWVQDRIPDADVSIVHVKGRHYGRVLFDDWPKYIEPWLKYRPRGQVLMLDQPWNQGYSHPQVMRILKGADFESYAPSIILALKAAAERP